MGKISKSKLFVACMSTLLSSNLTLYGTHLVDSEIGKSTLARASGAPAAAVRGDRAAEIGDIAPASGHPGQEVVSRSFYIDSTHDRQRECVSKLQQLSNLTELSLCGYDGGLKEIGFLVSALREAPSLVSLDLNLCGNDITDFGALAEAFQYISGIRTLKLNVANRRPIELAQVALALDNIRQLTSLELDLSCRPIADLSALAASLGQLQHLTSLSLSLFHNGRPHPPLNEGPLADALRKLPDLTSLELFLRSSRLGSIREILGALNHLNKLTRLVLDLRYQLYIPSSEYNFLEYAFRSMLKLKVLKLYLGDKGCRLADGTPVANALQHLPGLTSLHLTLQSTEFKEITGLCAALKGLTSLTNLNLNFINNKFTDISELAEAIKAMPHLTELSLTIDQNKLTDISPLAEALQTLKDLNDLKLDFGWNSIQDVNSLGRVLRELPRIRSLELGLAATGLTDIGGLAEAIRSMPSLRCLNLDVSYNHLTSENVAAIEAAGSGKLLWKIKGLREQRPR